MRCSVYVAVGGAQLRNADVEQRERGTGRERETETESRLVVCLL